MGEQERIMEYTKKLISLFEKMPVSGETDPACRETVREIGWEIYNSDIARGMRKVAEAFAHEMPHQARRLDMLWDGVGSWMG